MPGRRAGDAGLEAVEHRHPGALAAGGPEHSGLRRSVCLVPAANAQQSYLPQVVPETEKHPAVSHSRPPLRRLRILELGDVTTSAIGQFNHRAANPACQRRIPASSCP